MHSVDWRVPVGRSNRGAGGRRRCRLRQPWSVCAKTCFSSMELDRRSTEDPRLRRCQMRPSVEDLHAGYPHVAVGHPAIQQSQHEVPSIRGLSRDRERDLTCHDSVSWLTGGSPPWTDVATPQIAPRMDADTVPVISHVCAKPGVDALSISTPTTNDIRIFLITASREYHSRGRCTSYVLPTHGTSAFPQGRFRGERPDPSYGSGSGSEHAVWAMNTGVFYTASVTGAVTPDPGQSQAVTAFTARSPPLVSPFLPCSTPARRSCLCSRSCSICHWVPDLPRPVRHGAGCDRRGPAAVIECRVRSHLHDRHLLLDPLLHTACRLHPADLASVVRDVLPAIRDPVSRRGRSRPLLPVHYSAAGGSA